MFCGVVARFLSSSVGLYQLVMLSVESVSGRVDEDGRLDLNNRYESLYCRGGYGI